MVKKPFFTLHFIIEKSTLTKTNQPLQQQVGQPDQRGQFLKQQSNKLIKIAGQPAKKHYISSTILYLYTRVIYTKGQEFVGNVVL